MAFNTTSIVSWNINGIRATKTPLKTILDAFESEIICLQETKTTRKETYSQYAIASDVVMTTRCVFFFTYLGDLINETLANIDGYNSYFSFSRKRSGYSGVVTYCKNSAVPEAAEDGLTGLLTTESSKDVIGHYGESNDDHTMFYLQSLDGEGRAVLTKHVIRTDAKEKAYLTVINVYCPRADPEKPERLEFKLNFYKVLQARAEAILSSGSYVMIVGDINISHKPIDHCDPYDEEMFCSVPSRIFLDQFLASREADNEFVGGKFVDSFRYFNPTRTEAFTCWRTDTRARQTNYGTRLDYIFCDRSLLKESIMKDSEILAEVSGSDHCPVKGVLNCIIIPAPKCPSLCSKYWPEFAGRQTKLVSFLSSKKDSIVKHEKLVDIECESTQGDEDATTNLTKKRKLSTNAAKTVKQATKQKTVMDFFKTKETETAKTKNETEKCDRTVSLDKISSKPIDAWKKLLKGPKLAPMCTGHNESSVLRTVKKAGPNLGRDFYVCARPEGHSSNPNSSCNFFKWASNSKK